MFFDFFQFVLHTDNQFLDIVVIGFGAHGIDLATDLLGDETKLATGSLFPLGSLDEITAVVGQADFLLGDVEFLKIINDFPAPGDSRPRS